MSSLQDSVKENVESENRFSTTTFKKNRKTNRIGSISLDPKNFSGETTDMNGHLFQTIDESKDATQYVKTVEALERYAFKTYKVDLSSIFRRDDPELPSIEIPEKPSEDEINESPAVEDIYQLKLKEFVKDERALKVALKSMFAVIWGQCSNSIRTKLEKKKNIQDIKSKGDVVQLLLHIRHACMNYEDKHHPCITLCQQFSAFHVFYQREGLPIQKYIQIFRVIVENIERYGGEFGNHGAILQYVLDRDGLTHGNKFEDLNEEYKIIYKKKARDQFLAISFLLGGTRSKYSQLVADLQNSYIMGVDQYPKDLEEAYDMMLSYSSVVASVNPSNKEIKDLYTTGISFYQATTPTDHHNTEPPNKIVPGVSGKTSKNIMCYACNMMGHYANDCPDPGKATKQEEDKDTDKKGFSFMQCALNLTQMDGKLLNPKWVLLNTQSSCDIFNNADLLQDIKVEPGSGLSLHSNGDGLIETNMTGMVQGYGRVWFHPKSLANIMSFSNVRKKFQVQINTGPNDRTPSINVIKTNGSVMKFKEIGSGLYVYDASRDIKNKDTLKKGCHYSFVSTIKNNETKFTPREVAAAKQALDLHKKLGRPAYDMYMNMIENSLIRDCPITTTDVKRAMAIYGKDFANIKGKTKRFNPKHIKNPTLINLPDHILKWHLHVTICIDIFYVNKMSFFHTISMKLQFRTVEYIG